MIDWATSGYTNCRLQITKLEETGFVFRSCCVTSQWLPPWRLPRIFIVLVRCPWISLVNGHSSVSSVSPWTSRSPTFNSFLSIYSTANGYGVSTLFYQPVWKQVVSHGVPDRMIPDAQIPFCRCVLLGLGSAYLGPPAAPPQHVLDSE